MHTSSEADWTAVTPPDAPAYHLYTKPIQQSPQDDREYSVVRLQNGLHATLVHDAKADKAAASLDVAVGHLYDPDDMPGLAHFCEHLLFMGTKEYPKENDYSEFLAKNNGASNAYTATSNTNYYFNVATSALAPSLSRFAAFFHSPLFSPSCTVRELNAVDSEHKKNHQQDAWRIFQLNKHLSRPGHVWNKFGSGNKDTLTRAAKTLQDSGKAQKSEDVPKSTLLTPPETSRAPSPAPSLSNEDDGGAIGRETRRRLVEWWEKEYCSSRMRLCVVGKESLEDLAKLVSTNFSPIAHRNRDPLPFIEGHPFGENEMGTQVSVDTIMRFHAIEMSFPLPYQAPNWKHKPADLLSHFVGHEGPGSLHAYLKKKGWITSLSSGPQNLARGFAMFKVTVYLTLDGFKNHKEIQLACFKYLSMLRASEISSYHQHETHQVSSIAFRFQEKRRPDDYASWISEHMSWPAPPELVLKAPRFIWDWDTPEDREIGHELLRSTLAGLTADKCRTVLMAKADEHAALHETPVQWEQEPIYGTKYHVARPADDFMAKACSANDIPDLFLPPPNDFIPTNLGVDKKDVEQTMTRPHLIRETPLSELWHKKDDQFWVPKASVILDMRSPVANASPLASVLTTLYADLVRDALNEYMYAAELAGLNYNFAPATNGLYATMSGYNDKLSTLVQCVLEKVKTLSIDPHRLEVMREQNKRDWDNFSMSQSYQLADYHARHLLTARHWTVQQKLEELSNATPDLLREHIQNMLCQMHVRILVHGNIYKEEAIKIAELAESGLKPCSLSPGSLDDLSLILPPSSNHTWSLDSPNPDQPNSAISYYMYLGSGLDPRRRVVSSLLAQILSEPAFNVLRTKEQLGYIVHCSLWNQSGSTHKGIRIIVQSEKGPTYLEYRVEEFLRSMKTTLEEMPEETFLEQRAGLDKKWREADKNLSEEANRFWAHIGSGLYDFHRKTNDADLLQEVTKDEVLALFSSHADPSASARSKLSVHTRSIQAKPKMVSTAAAQAFADLIKSRPNGTAELAEKISIQESMPAADFMVASKDKLIAANWTTEETAEVFTQLEALTEKHPVDPVVANAGGLAVTYVENAVAFKKSLAVSEPPRPIIQWGDLPTSRL